MAQPNTSAQGSEPRHGLRKKVRETAFAISSEGDLIASCTIRDLSASGARIIVSESDALPAQFVLLDTRNRMVYDAAVVWTSGRERGLKFSRAFPIDHRLPPDLAFAKRLWISLSSA